ncbi:hypothetical protein O181_131611 [Austropuccinia psidii MF-1]|uniref:Uncharacterized protein n=1 Tax=Austropuccinia psidii MF-1 TaxID=1389203 RepID=A0A9Q3L504_9BASI|nr:hypothetical protein [Austropuccinia psidii MF-1]
MARRVPVQDALMRTPLLSMMMKAIPSGDGCHNPKQAYGNTSARLSWCPQVLIFPPPLLGQHPIVTSLLDRIKLIIQPMKHGNGERTFKLELCHPVTQKQCTSMTAKIP